MTTTTTSADSVLAFSSSSREELLSAFKVELGPDLCQGVDDEYLLLFLYWKGDVKRAAERYRSLVAWKASPAATEGIHFDHTLRLSEDPELERLIASEVIIAPPNLHTREGSPILIGRFRNNDMTDGRTVDGVCRMMYYTIDQVLCQRDPQTLYNTTTNNNNKPTNENDDASEDDNGGITIIHDLRGFNREKNARLEISKRLFQGVIGKFPIQVKAIYICYAPFVFVAFFRLVSLFMPKKLRGRIHFIANFEQLDQDHMNVLDPKTDLLPEMGGTFEWNVNDWIKEQKIKEQSETIPYKSLTNINPIVSAASSSMS